MTERETLWGRDIDDAVTDVDDIEYSNGQHDPSTDRIPVIDPRYAAPETVLEDPDGYGNGPAEERISYTQAFTDRAVGSSLSALTFKPAPPAWYRTKPALFVLLAVVAIAVVAAIIPLVLRSPGSTSEEPSVAPTSAAPSPSANSVEPTLTSAPVPPAPPLPPPPPAPPQETAPPAQDAPVYTRQYPAPRGSSEAPKPDIDVTRAPISVAPEPRRPPPNDATVGDGRKRGWGW